MASDKLARAQLARAATRFRADGLPCLILMTDDATLPDPRAAAHALPHGSLVILRGTALRFARDIHAIRGLRLLIANDGALAARIGADGIHLSEARAHEAAHWRARHPGWLITAAAHSLRATAVQADAVLLSPIFATRSHPGAKTLGLRALTIARQAATPVYALGGVDAITVRRLDGGAFAGVAAISALT
ncbi:MAG TPA: thiamine phosphate synthase [Rhizomicrobium sp.]|jgi:thiamine-phosphate pyrophosphorylase